MDFLTIALFFIYTYGLGFSLTRIAKESDNFLERNLIRVGLGIGVMIVLGLLLNLLRIPLDWRTFLIASLIVPAYYILKNAKSLIENSHLNLKMTKYDINILVVILIFFASFYMYAHGAFSYPWLEDDDSWGHALGVKYVAAAKTLFADKPLRYIDPYPPSYDMLLGILHQTNNSLYWTLKFFNALIISLSIIFFFFFAKELIGKNKALFAAFVLASIPAYLSHFIWAIALSMPLYFLAFYAFEKIKDDKRWFMAAAIMIAAVLTTSPSHGIYFGLFLGIYYLAKIITEKRIFLYHLIAGLSGLVLAFILWWIPAILKHGIRGVLNGIGSNPNTSILDVAGTADRLYNLNDFFIAQKTNMINSPVGVGLVVSFLIILGLASLLYKSNMELKNKKSKGYLIVFTLFLLMAVSALFFLSSTYVKYATKVGTPPLPRGSVPFFGFLSGQLFVVTSLLAVFFVLSTLIAASYYKPDFAEKYATVVLAWLAFSFFALNSGPYYYKITPFRVWSIFAVPAAILAGEGMSFITSLFNRIKFLKISAVLMLVIGVLATSAYQKYTVNTAQWPPGAFWTSGEELQGYLWLKENLPQQSKLFTFSASSLVVGMDKYICYWCRDIQEYQRNGFNQSALQNHEWLKKAGFEYMLIDGAAAKRFGSNETNSKVKDLIDSNRFKPVFNNNGIVIFRIL